MSSEKFEDLSEFEKSLARLEPAPPLVSRDRLLFEAGRRSAKRTLAWPAATYVFALATIWLGIELRNRPAPPPVRQLAVTAINVKGGSVPIPNPKPATTTVVTPVERLPDVTPDLPANSYLKLRNLALRAGVDSLSSLQPRHDESWPETAKPLTVGSWRDIQ